MDGFSTLQCGQDNTRQGDSGRWSAVREERAEWPTLHMEQQRTAPGEWGACWTKLLADASEIKVLACWRL